MDDTSCPLIDITPRGTHKRYTCYVNGRLLGLQWMADYCLAGSNVGHSECPLRKSPEGIQFYARLKPQKEGKDG